VNKIKIKKKQKANRRYQWTEGERRMTKQIPAKKSVKVIEVWGNSIWEFYLFIYLFVYFCSTGA
jgi:hypothetical protein